MENEKGNKMLNSFKKTSEQAMINWGNDFINTNIPKFLDSMVAKVKEVASSASKIENKKTIEQIRDIIFQGIEIGESNKEIAIVAAMKNAGIRENTIQTIINNSNNYLVTRADYEERLNKK